jgi:hypothetical protein
MVRETGLHSSVYGILDLKEIALRSGTANPWLLDLSFIVFISQQEQHVRTFIIRFNGIYRTLKGNATVNQGHF